MPVAIDNSVLGDITDSNLPKNKLKDRNAFEKMLELDKQDILEIGIPISSTMIEESQSGEDKRNLLRERMGRAFRLWPVAIPQGMSNDIENKKKCLKNIMQDKEGIDSDNLVVSTIHTSYYITTDYRYCRQFKAQLEKIKKICGINVFVLTPSEFMAKYKAGEI